jgi:hypothetical protein
MSCHRIDTAHKADDGTETVLRVYYTFSEYVPEQGPSYASGGQPEEAARLEFESVWRRDGTRWWIAPEFVEWAANWLTTEGAADAISRARDDLIIAREDAAEARAAARREGY